MQICSDSEHWWAGYKQDADRFTIIYREFTKMAVLESYFESKVRSRPELQANNYNNINKWRDGVIPNALDMQKTS